MSIRSFCQQKIMARVLEPEEEAAIFIYVLQGCHLEVDRSKIDEDDIVSYPENYRSFFAKYSESGCSTIIPTIIEKYGSSKPLVVYRGQGRDMGSPEDLARDRTIAPGMANRMFFSTSSQIKSAVGFTGVGAWAFRDEPTGEEDVGCCVFEITLKNAKFLPVYTISFDRSRKLRGEGETDEQRKQRNERFDGMLQFDREVLVKGGGTFVDQKGPATIRAVNVLHEHEEAVEKYTVTYAGNDRGGLRRTRRRRARMSRRR